jgi:hypothetical protein
MLTCNVHVHDLGKVFWVVFQGGLDLALVTGVVPEAVNLLETEKYRLNHLIDLLEVANVADVGFEIEWRRSKLSFHGIKGRFQARFAIVNRRNTSSAFRKEQASFSAKLTASASDYNSLSGEAIVAARLGRKGV